MARTGIRCMVGGEYATPGSVTLPDPVLWETLNANIPHNDPRCQETHPQVLFYDPPTEDGHKHWIVAPSTQCNQCQEDLANPVEVQPLPEDPTP